MNLTQALSQWNSYCSTGWPCDRCGQPTSHTFNWDMVETLCPGCFMRELYEHTSFPLYLPRVDTRERLVSLCQAYQFRNLFFPPGPDADDDPSSFFGVEITPKDNPCGDRGNHIARRRRLNSPAPERTDGGCSMTASSVLLSPKNG